LSDVEPGILNIEDEDGVDVNGRYVTGAYGLGYDDVVVLFVLSPAPPLRSADGLVGSNIDLINLKLLKKVKKDKINNYSHAVNYLLCDLSSFFCVVNKLDRGWHLSVFLRCSTGLRT
jgi:hypothetical protein